MKHARELILSVIGVAALIVIGFLLFNLIATPEFLVKREVETIVKDYYENYFYHSILKNNSLTLDDLSTPEKSIATMSPILERYIEKGFARLTLRQLTLYDNLRHHSSAAYLSKYCDLNSTLIHITPVAPFQKENYQVDYSYSCNFK